MKYPEVLAYIAECKKQNKCPEVKIGGVRFFLESKTFEGDSSPTIVLETYLNTALDSRVNTEDSRGWEYFSQKDGRAIKPIPFRYLYAEVEETEKV